MGESNLEIKEAYVVDPFAQHYFIELWVERKVKGITLKDGLIKWKWFQLYMPTGKLHKNHVGITWCPNCKTMWWKHHKGGIGETIILV